MSVVRPVVGMRIINLFIAHFFNQPCEHGAGNVTHVNLVDFAKRLLLFFHFEIYYIIQSPAPPIGLL